MIDLLSNLIELNFGTYHDLMSAPYSRIIKLSKMLGKNYKDKLKAKQEYDVSLMKAFKCPLYTK